MEIITKLVAELLPAKYNPRKDLKPGDIEYENLRRSIEEFGCVEPIVWNQRSNRVVGGHQRLKVLWNAGVVKTEVVVVDLPEEKEKALNIALNKISGDWDVPKLKDLLADLKAMDFDLSLTGFDVPEIEDILGNGEVVEDEPPPVPEKPVTKTGDLYLLDAHRVLCGDATKSENIERLMAGRRVDMVFTDPPYGKNQNTDYSGISRNWKGQIPFAKSKKYNPVLGDNHTFNPVCIFKYFNYCAEIFLWGADYYNKSLLNDGAWFVWDKTENQSQEVVGSEFELCWSKAAHKRQIIPVKWSGAMGLQTQDIRKRIHPTQKPIELGIWFIKKFSKKNNLVVDLFLGSGSTLIAAEQTGRLLYGCEIDEGYTDVVVNRWEKFTGRKAILDNG